MQNESSEQSGGAIQHQTRSRRRDEKPVLSLLADRYAMRMEFQPTGDASRDELAEAFVSNARSAAERYVEMEECSRPAAWNDFTRDPESRHWMNKHFDERQAWAKSIDLLWRFSEGEDVDADALREALVRMSLRRHRDGSRRDRNEEHIFVKAAGIVREKAGLDRMAEPRREEIGRDYR
jgi:hypothetical protein